MRKIGLCFLLINVCFLLHAQEMVTIAFKAPANTPQNATINVVIANGEEFENILESWSQMYYRTGTDLFEVKVPKSYLEARAIAQAGSESKVKMKFILNGDFDNYALETTGNMAPAELPAYNDNVPKEGDVSKEFVKSKQFIALADPQIFFHENNYYLYGTLSGGRGLEVYSSPDLVSWTGPCGVKDNGFIMAKDDAYGTADYWAPHIISKDGKIIMTYSANQHLAWAESNSPLGPFVNPTKAPMGDVERIDSYVFTDDDGQMYLYHSRFVGGNVTHVAKMNPDFTIQEETTVECVRPDQPWEQYSYVVTEGPSVLKHNGKYYLFYSANLYTDARYAVGYAISDSPMGPWTKMPDSPIISLDNINKAHGVEYDFEGTGHGDFFTDAAGQLQYCFHAHNPKGADRYERIVLTAKCGFQASDTGVDKMVVDPASTQVLYMDEIRHQVMTASDWKKHVPVYLQFTPPASTPADAEIHVGSWNNGGDYGFGDIDNKCIKLQKDADGKYRVEINPDFLSSGIRFVLNRDVDNIAQWDKGNGVYDVDSWDHHDYRISTDESIIYDIKKFIRWSKDPTEPQKTTYIEFHAPASTPADATIQVGSWKNGGDYGFGDMDNKCLELKKESEGLYITEADAGFAAEGLRFILNRDPENIAQWDKGDGTYDIDSWGHTAISENDKYLYRITKFVRWAKDDATGIEPATAEKGYRYIVSDDAITIWMEKYGKAYLYDIKGSLITCQEGTTIKIKAPQGGDVFLENSIRQ